MPEPIASTAVVNADRDLTVSTVKLSRTRFDTVVFDNSPDKANNGKCVGRWVIDRSSEWTTSRDEAMDAHRDAVYAARVEPLTDPAA